MSKVRIVTSGSNGRSGSSGSSGGYGGGYGGRGGDGTDGRPASTIDITLKPDGHSSSCSIVGTHSGTLRYSNASGLFLESKGGYGGDGGSGGSGGTGTTGSSGSNATQYSSGGNGGAGGRGGDGGDGGDAGDGGNGANCTVKVSDQDMDLIMMVDSKCDCSGGAGGTGGRGGYGGAGGQGGSGGAGYSWTTQTSSTVNGQTTYTTHYHSNPGGSSGPSGSPGSSGSRGSDGRRGRNGVWKEVVHGVGEYTWRYVMQQQGARALDDTTQDGIFEPGEDCKLWYDLKNTGPMPSPKVQNMMCSIDNNNWVLNSTTVHCSQKFISSGRSAPLERAIDFNLSDTTEPAPNKVFAAKTSLVWSVYVERVNKYFTAQELGAPQSLEIKYPVRLSPTHGPGAIARSEECPLTICLHNLCQKALGYNAGRNLRVHCALVQDANGMRPMTDANIASLVDEHGQPMQNYDIPQQRLMAGNNDIPSCLVRFGQHAKEYSKVCVGIELFLGHIKNFSRDRRVQRMSLDVQLSEYYAPRKNSDLLIVTNHATSYDSFEQWKRTADTLRFVEPNFWNATLHDGLTLTQKCGGSCVKDDYRCATIVVENNNPNFLTATRSERNEDREHAFDTLINKELTPAMRDENMGFLIIGRSVDTRVKLLPTDYHDVAIPTAYPHFSPWCRNKDWWIERLQAIQQQSSCKNGKSQDIDFEKMHQFYKQSAPNMSNQAAWQLVLGVTITRFGERMNEPIRMKRWANLQERLTNFFAMYSPHMKPTVIKSLVRNFDTYVNKRRSNRSVLSSPRKTPRREVIDDDTPKVLNDGQPLLDNRQDQHLGYGGGDGGDVSAPYDDEQMFEELQRIFGPELLPSEKYKHVYANIHPRTMTLKQVRVEIYKQALTLYDEVSQLRPQWKFTVVYELSPYLARQDVADAARAKHKIGDVVLESVAPQDYPRTKKMCLGRIWIYRAADRNAAAIMYKAQNSQSPISPSDITSDSMTYCIEKAAPFQKKLWNLVDEDFVSTMARREALGVAIISDLVEEQVALRRFHWSYPVPDWVILEHCPRFCAWIDTCWSVTSADASFVEKGKVILAVSATTDVLLNRWINALDTVMFSRRWRIVTGMLTPMLTNVMMERYPKTWERACFTERKRTDKFTLRELIDHHAAGLEQRRSSGNTEVRSRVIAATTIELHKQREKPAQLVEGKWEMHSARDRQLILHKLRTDFARSGDVKAKVTRDEQHQSLNFISCPGDHSSLQATQQGSCTLCGESMAGVGPHSRRCGPCNWNICSVCWSAGNAARWRPNQDRDE